jgi:hypothetical protein
MRQYGGGIDSYEEALEYVSSPGILFYITYLNVVILTGMVLMLFGLLYLFFRDTYPAASLSGMLFVPVYAAYNLLVYVSQVSMVPKLIENSGPGAESEVMEFFLGHMIQMYEGSAIGMLNHFAYAVLGVPSILYGRMVYRLNPAGKISGAALILSGTVCMIGFAGILAGNEVLSFGSALGGMLFWLALLAMAFSFYGILKQQGSEQIP